MQIEFFLSAIMVHFLPKQKDYVIEKVLKLMETKSEPLLWLLHHFVINFNKDNGDPFPIRPLSSFFMKFPFHGSQIRHEMPQSYMAHYFCYNDL